MVKSLNGFDSIPDELNSHAAQLAEIVQTVNFYNPIDNTDITSELNTLVNDTSIRKIFVKKGNYTISNPIYANRDDIEIDFNGSTLNFLTTSAINNTSRRISVLNFVGTVDTTQYTFSYIDVKHSYNSNDVQGTDAIGSICTMVTVTDGTKFSIGDYVFLYVVTGDITSTTQFNPMIAKVVKINNIIGNNLYLEYYSPFTVSTDPTLFTSAYIQKVTPRKNIRVKNLNIYDEMSLPSGYDITTYVSGVRLEYCIDSEVENLTTTNMKLNALPIYMCNNVKASHIKTIEPLLVDAGHGYTIQCSNTVYSDFENITGIKSRHNIDFTGSAFCKISNSKDFMSRNHWTTHAQYDHHLIFENVHGGFFGVFHGMDQGACAANLTYINCSGNWLGGVTFDSIFENCSIDITAYFHSQATLKNCNVRVIGANLYNNQPLRGQWSYLKCENTIISFNKDLSGNFQNWSINYATLNFNDGCKILMDSTLPTNSVSVIVLNCWDVKLKCDVTSAIFAIGKSPDVTNTENTINLNFIGVNYLDNQHVDTSGSLIQIFTTDTTLIINININGGLYKSDHNTTTYYKNIINLPSSNATNNRILINGAKFTGNFSLTNSATATTLITKGNIVEGLYQPSAMNFTTDNVYISGS